MQRRSWTWQTWQSCALGCRPVQYNHNHPPWERGAPLKTGRGYWLGAQRGVIHSIWQPTFVREEESMSGLLLQPPWLTFCIKGFAWKTQQSGPVHTENTHRTRTHTHTHTHTHTREGGYSWPSLYLLSGGESSRWKGMRVAGRGEKWS